MRQLTSILTAALLACLSLPVCSENPVALFFKQQLISGVNELLCSTVYDQSIHRYKLSKTKNTDFNVIRASVNSEEIISIANENKRRVKNCLRKTYRKNPDFQGFMVVKFVIHPRGYVLPETVRIMESNLRDQSVENCITNTIKRWKNFPETSEEGYPIVQKYIF